MNHNKVYRKERKIYENEIAKHDADRGDDDILTDYGGICSGLQRRISG